MITVIRLTYQHLDTDVTNSPRIHHKLTRPRSIRTIRCKEEQMQLVNVVVGIPMTSIIANYIH